MDGEHEKESKEQRKWQRFQRYRHCYHYPNLSSFTTPTPFFSLLQISEPSPAATTSLRESQRRRPKQHLRRKRDERVPIKNSTRTQLLSFYNNNSHLHIPVMLSEVLDVFSNCSLTSFVDCTLGAAGHSTNVIRGHPELKYFVGIDVDPVASDVAQSRISSEEVTWSGCTRTNEARSSKFGSTTSDK